MKKNVKNFKAEAIAISVLVTVGLFMLFMGVDMITNTEMYSRVSSFAMSSSSTGRIAGDLIFMAEIMIVSIVSKTFWGIAIAVSLVMVAFDGLACAYNEHLFDRRINLDLSTVKEIASLANNMHGNKVIVFRVERDNHRVASKRSAM